MEKLACVNPSIGFSCLTEGFNASLYTDVIFGTRALHKFFLGVRDCPPFCFVPQGNCVSDVKAVKTGKTRALASIYQALRICDRKWLSELSFVYSSSARHIISCQSACTSVIYV